MAKERPEQEAPSEATQPDAPKKWLFLFYLCGDNDLASYIEADFREICSVGSTDNIQVLVQIDRPDGAKRYVLADGGAATEQLVSDPSLNKARVNTGDPKEAIEFFRWGMTQFPTERVAIIFSGLGIDPKYVEQRVLRQRPQLKQRIENDKDADDQQAAHRELETLVNSQLFSLCHDFTSNDALEPHELREILETLQRDGLRVDLFGLDVGGAAFIEFAYELEDLADALVAAPAVMPDDGWPYDRIVKLWDDKLRTPKPSDPLDGRQLASTVVDTVAKAYPELQSPIVAVNLSNYVLSRAARVLDTLALALLYNLGDWHILESLNQTNKSCVRLQKRSAKDAAELCNATQCDLHRVYRETADESDDSTEPASENIEPSGLLPAVDLLQLLGQLRKSLEKQEKLAPDAFGQKERLQRLLKLTMNALNELDPALTDAEIAAVPKDSDTSAYQASWLASNRLYYIHDQEADRELSILLPGVGGNLQKSQTRPSDYNYFHLRFSSRVHWASLLGVFQMILEKPHVLWRLIGSMLATESSGTRDAVLGRLIGPRSVMSGLKQEMQVFQEDGSLTLSLENEPNETCSCDDYRLRLESSIKQATLAEHVTKVFPRTFETAVRGLEAFFIGEQILWDSGPLETLGRTLGEDVIQRFGDRLREERRAMMTPAGRPPHLRLRIPRELMRYPWELMYDRDGMLCEQYAVGRQVFMELAVTRPPVQRQPGMIRALVIGDPVFSDSFEDHPEQLPGARTEAATVVETLRQLDEQLAQVPSIQVTHYIGVRLTVLEMRELLRSGHFDIVHFAGHAKYVEGCPEASAWALSDGLLTAREIANTLAWTDSPPWMVYASACEAAMDGREASSSEEGETQTQRTTKRYYGDVYGLATAFINEGVAAYIGPLWPVVDHVAAGLARAFYRELLLEQASLGESLWKAKHEMKQFLLPEDEIARAWAFPAREALSWASFVLYGDPTPRLLESLWAPRGAKPTEDEESAAAGISPRPKPSVPPAELEPPAVGVDRRIVSGMATRGPSRKKSAAHVYRVWYGTNRKPVNPRNIAKGFGAESDERIHYGACQVTIPKSHRFGELGSPWWERWFFMFDDRLKLQDTHALSREMYWASMHAALAQALAKPAGKELRNERDILVYLHGFNVSFEEAALRAAQIGFDLNFPGVTAFYSWPSRGDLMGYDEDGEMVQASEAFICQYFDELLEHSGAERIHVLVHSMGNRGMLRVLKHLVEKRANVEASGASKAGLSKFGQIILAAPDVDSLLFEAAALAYPQISDRTTMYVSATDLALASSMIVNRTNRAGFTPPITVVKGIDTIEVSNIDVSLLGHSYFAEAEPVLYDIRELILTHGAMIPRSRMEQVAAENPNEIYWRIRK